MPARCMAELIESGVEAGLIGEVTGCRQRAYLRTRPDGKLYWIYTLRGQGARSQRYVSRNRTGTIGDR